MIACLYVQVNGPSQLESLINTIADAIGRNNVLDASVCNPICSGPDAPSTLAELAAALVKVEDCHLKGIKL